MGGCRQIRLQFLDLLRDPVSPDKRAGLDDHLAACPACAQEFRSLEAMWRGLAQPVEPEPPTVVRQSVLAYAERAAEAGEGFLAGLWWAVRGWWVPVSLGAGAALAVVALLQLRGAVAPLGQPAAVAASLFLAVGLAGVAGVLWGGAAARTVRAMLVGSLAALGGYVALTLVSPIPESVQFCRVALFRSAVMSMTQLCLVYAAVAALYGGVPVGLAAYRWPGSGAGRERWRVGLAEAGVFTLLAAPTAVLQSGVEDWIITLTVLAGLAAGSLTAGVLGTWAGARRVARQVA